MQENFDEHTTSELMQFHTQRQTAHLLGQMYEDEMDRIQALLKKKNIVLEKSDASKIYAELSVKDLILGNRLTGPSLCLNQKLASVLH